MMTEKDLNTDIDSYSKTGNKLIKESHHEGSSWNVKTLNNKKSEQETITGYALQ